MMQVHATTKWLTHQLSYSERHWLMSGYQLIPQTHLKGLKLTSKGMWSAVSRYCTKGKAISLV